MTDAEWDEYIDALYARWVADNEAYAFEDNYEPFEVNRRNQTMNYLPQHVNRS